MTRLSQPSGAPSGTSIRELTVSDTDEAAEPETPDKTVVRLTVSLVTL